MRNRATSGSFGGTQGDGKGGSHHCMDSHTSLGRRVLPRICARGEGRLPLQALPRRPNLVAPVLAPTDCFCAIIGDVSLRIENAVSGTPNKKPRAHWRKTLRNQSSVFLSPNKSSPSVQVLLSLPSSAKERIHTLNKSISGPMLEGCKTSKDPNRCAQLLGRTPPSSAPARSPVHMRCSNRTEQSSRQPACKLVFQKASNVLLAHFTTLCKELCSPRDRKFRMKGRLRVEHYWFHSVLQTICGTACLFFIVI